MRLRIEFCATNLKEGSVPAFARLKQDYPQARLRAYGCLGMCSQCDQGPYCLVNGQYVSGRDAEELYRNVVALIRQLEAAQA